MKRAFAHLLAATFAAAAAGPAGAFQADDSHPTYIVVLDSSTYLGAGGEDRANDISCTYYIGHPSVPYLIGTTSSHNFPTAALPYRFVPQAVHGGGTADVFIASISGSSLTYSTFLGGEGADSGASIFKEQSPCIYVSGTTRSLDFPSRSSHQSSIAGFSDAFIAKSTATHSTLVWATYLGGSGNDRACDVVPDWAEPFLTLVGTTDSNDFPTLCPYQASLGGGSDVFIARFCELTGVLFGSTYLGGSGDDYSRSVCVTGALVVTGYTWSDDFPLQSAYQTSRAGGSDCFASAFEGIRVSNLQYSTYFGGSGDDRVEDCLDCAEGIYLTGSTSSPDFPTYSAYQSSLAGDTDAFVSIFTPDPGGSVFRYSSYLGGSGYDSGNAIDTDGYRLPYVAGVTQSTDFPTAAAIQGRFGGGASDAFAARLVGGGSGLTFSTYLGGGGEDSATGISVSGGPFDPVAISIAGFTSSSDYPIINAYQPFNHGGMDAFFSLIGLFNRPGNGEKFNDPLWIDSQFSGVGDISAFRCDYEFYSCNPPGRLESGRDAIYAFSIPHGRAINIVLSGLSADLDLFLCRPGSAHSCVASSTNSGTHYEIIRYVGDGGIYFIAVDSPFDVGESYALDLVCVPTPTPLVILSPTPSPTPSATPTPTPSPSPTSTRTPTPRPSPSPSPTPTCGPSLPPARMAIASGDYDGDGTSDVAVFRPDQGNWFVRGLTRLCFGNSLDQPVSGDYDGDGTAEAAVFRPSAGLWAVANLTRASFGSSADLAVPADYDGDGACDAAAFRESEGLWIVRFQTRFYFGCSGDWPVPADYPGDGTAAAGIYRPSSGQWPIRGLTRFYFGGAGDWPIPGNYFGAGESLFTIFRGCSGTWAIRDFTQIQFGACFERPCPADFDGDGLDDPAVFRPESALWRVWERTRIGFGLPDDLPVIR